MYIMAINLKEIVKKETIAWIEYPKIPGFEVKIKYLSKKDLMTLANKCSVKKMDKANPGNFKEEIDLNKYRDIIAREILISWRGLTVRSAAENLIPIEYTEENAEEIIEPTLDNKKAVLEYSAEFDVWINNIMTQLSIFQSSKEQEEVDNIKK